MSEFNNERADSSHCVARLFSEPQDSWAISGLIDCSSNDFQDQNLSLITGYNQDLIFPASWIGKGRMTRVFSIHCLTKHITLLHLLTPALKMTISHLHTNFHHNSYSISWIQDTAFLLAPPLSTPHASYTPISWWSKPVALIQSQREDSSQSSDPGSTVINFGSHTHALFGKNNKIKQTYC